MKAFCSMKIRIKDLSLSMLPEQGLAVVPGQCRDPGPVPQILMIGTGTQSHGTVRTTGTKFLQVHKAHFVI